MSDPAPSPRVSVGIPTWNRAELLRECIQSVLDQTMPDFELHVFDNASTDATPEVVASFDDPRITYVRRDQNLGNQPNMTAALRAGTAPYVYLLLDDERLLPTCLQRKAEFLDRHPDVVLVHSVFEEVSVDNEPLSAWASFSELTTDTVETGPTFIERSFLVPARVHLGSFLARREAVRTEGLFPEDRPLDDHPLFLRIATRGSIGFLAEPLDVRRIVPGVSSDAGYLVYENGRYRPTLWLVKEAKAVLFRFTEGYATTPAEARRLRRLARRGARRSATYILRNRVPGFRPVKQAARDLVEAVRVEPTILAEPRLLTVLFPRLARIRPAVTPPG